MIQHIVQYSKIKHSIVKYCLQSIIVRINYNEDLVTYVRSIVQDTAMQCTVVQYKVQYSAIRYNTVYLITLLYRKKYATIHYNTFNSTQYNKYITGITRKYNTVKFSLLQPSKIQLYSTVKYNYINSLFRLYSAVRRSTVQYVTINYSTVQYITEQYFRLQCSTMQYNIVQYSTIQYSNTWIQGAASFQNATA